MTSPTLYSANLDGLRTRPCDPLILAINGDGRPLRGLTAEVDWRIAGQLSEFARQVHGSEDSPILRPPHPLVPCGRLILLRVGAYTPRELVRVVRGLNASQPGLCPADFDFSDQEVHDAFRGDVILYGRTNDSMP
jgi:hypothetical protein